VDQQCGGDFVWYEDDGEGVQGEIESGGVEEVESKEGEID
jgi:hypothetical protein